MRNLRISDARGSYGTFFWQDGFLFLEFAVNGGRKQWLCEAGELTS